MYKILFEYLVLKLYKIVLILFYLNYLISYEILFEVRKHRIVKLKYVSNKSILIINEPHKKFHKLYFLITISQFMPLENNFISTLFLFLFF